MSTPANEKKVLIHSTSEGVMHPCTVHTTITVENE